jgi:hypothetical protein
VKKLIGRSTRTRVDPIVHPIYVRSLFRSACLVVLILLFSTVRGDAYSLLTHEQLIDLTWKSSIVPLLLSRYPTLTPAELEHARAYAYGGCVIQDIGYYPFGDQSFSNLTHYVRSGDFVVNLFRNAGNADELAFAIGAMSHYIGDSLGHSEATNLSVPVEFPKLRAEYGPVVSYGEGEHQHVQTEFAFDINDVVHHRIAPLRFFRHIGLEVPIKQLALAYYQTYGLTEDFSKARGRRFNVRAYRFAVHALIPRIAYALTLLHRSHEPVETANAEVAALDQELAVVAQESDWDAYRRRAGLGTYMLAGLIWVIPKVGPLTLVATKGPTAATEAEYIHSVYESELSLRKTLARFTPPVRQRSTAAEAARADTASQPPPARPLPANPEANQDIPRQSKDPRHPLPNLDLDTGKVVALGGYPLTDSTFASLLHQLTRQPARPIPPGIKREIQSYYANPKPDVVAREPKKQWAQVQADLTILAGMQTSTEPKPYPTYGDDAASTQQN